jgi:hypothetical protein
LVKQLLRNEANTVVRWYERWVNEPYEKAVPLRAWLKDRYGDRISL